MKEVEVGMIQIDMPMPDNAETIDVASVIQALKESYQKFSDDSDMFVDESGYRYALIDPNLILDSIDLLRETLPITPAKDGNGCLICGNQDFGCGVVGRYDVETGKVTEKYSDYCAFCGRRVKWE